MNVLSLFDGVSCGRVALERAGIPVDKYYASEIDKGAIAISNKNYPDIIRLGSVETHKSWGIDLSKIDLLIGGSPCQGFSVAGKQLNFDDPRSKLFFEYVDILNVIREKNPNVKFLLENVKMKKEYSDIITEYLGIEPIEINSSLVSAQSRRRLYWTNIKGVTQPADKGIYLKDIVHEKADMDTIMSDSWCKWFKERMDMLLSKQRIGVNSDKAVCMTARQYSNWQGNCVYEVLDKYIIPIDDTLHILETETKRGKIGFIKTDSQGNRVYSIHDKSITICGEAGGRGTKTGLYLFGCITPDRLMPWQNGQRFNDGNKFYTLTVKDRHGIFTQGYIRKLTPIECERLQTLPDNYTLTEIDGKTISDTRRYRALGNGWTVDVIAHILRFLKLKRARADKCYLYELFLV